MIRFLQKKVLCCFFIALTGIAVAQTGGVSINKSNTPADVSAILDVSSTASPYLGMLIPRMSTSNRNSIIAPATGLQIFNTDCGINEYYTGSCWLAMSQNLKSPGKITCSGTTDFCANAARTFTITAVTGATNYIWSVPAGATITAGEGTTSITVAFGNHSGDVCVTAENICETSQPRCINVFINPVPPTPGNITGPTVVAPNTTVSYFISAVAGAGVYNWSVPSGGTITSGVGTTAITVSFSCSAISGNVSVIAQNNCGSSSASSLAISITQVSANAGPPVTSPGTLGGSPTASGGASPYTYAWLPLTGLSSTTVSNPSTTVCSNTTYTVTVTDANGCTAKSSVVVTVAPVPATPGTISGTTSPACNSSNVYSISPVAYSTTYTWTVPAGATITAGQGTTSITVGFFGSSGNITVTAGNPCGTSSARSLAITVTGAGAGTQTFNATGVGRTGTIQSFTIPPCVISITIEAWGAGGGYGDDRCSSSNTSPGKGARMKGTFAVTPGQVLKVLVGQQGKSILDNYTCSSAGGGGGGGSFVTDNSNNPLIVAGGGGGENWEQFNVNGVDALTTNSGTGGGSTAGRAGSGGGLTGDGVDYNASSKGGLSFINGGTGGIGQTNEGGFGGGGGALYEGGGGGGYTGGNVITTNSYGGPQPTGAGSYNSGTNQSNTAGAQSGDGQVIINW